MSQTLTVESVPVEAIHVNIAYLCNVVVIKDDIPRTILIKNQNKLY